MEFPHLDFLHMCSRYYPASTSGLKQPMLISYRSLLMLRREPPLPLLHIPLKSLR